MSQFNSKETYLAYRAQWKADYKKLSAAIREQKLEIKKAQRNGSHMGSMERQRLGMSMVATQMLNDLADAKIEAQRQYLAQKQSSSGVVIL